MTEAECKKRIKEYKRIIENMELIKIALARSIAIEYGNIADLRKKAKNN